MTQKKEAFYSVRKIALDLLIEIMEKEASSCFELGRADGAPRLPNPRSWDQRLGHFGPFRPAGGSSSHGPHPYL